jgi:predicted nuclease of predicted toxin-antitoxin system
MPQMSSRAKHSWRPSRVASFLVDECVPRSVYEMLGREGHQVTLVRDVLLGADDESVLRLAYETSLTLITEDRRFGMLAMNAPVSAGVVIIAAGNISPDEKAKRVRAVLPSLLTLIPGSVTVIGRTRVRRRPVSL